MKHLYSLLTLVILSSCASQTKPVFFSSYNSYTYPNYTVAKQIDAKKKESGDDFGTLKYEKVNPTRESNLQQTGRPVLVASTNNAVVETFGEMESVSSRSIYYDQPKKSKQLDTKGQQKKFINKNSSATANGGDPNKNKFAAAGLITAFLSFLWPVAIVSIALSIIGLKSERKKQAITAIVIAVIFGLIGLLLAAAFAGV